jgi:serine/alanine adding enzyme
VPILDLTDQAAVDRYDDFVRSHPQRAVTQDRRWGVVKSEWGQEAVYAEQDGRIVAAMTVLVRRLPGGFSVLYAPRGPLVDWADPEMVHRILAEARPLVRRHRAVMTKIDPEVPFTAELDAWLRSQPGWVVKNVGADKDDVVQPRYNMIVRLRDEQGEPLDEEALLAKYDGKARNRVRTGRRKGVVTEAGQGEADLETFHRIYTQMARRNEITARGLPYFHRMREAFGDRMRVTLARHEEDVLAASVTIDYHGKLYYLYAGSTDVKRNLAANQVMNHEIMAWGVQHGAESYDMGGVFQLTSSDGLFLFKRAFCKADGVTEYIGEVDIVHRRLPYAVLDRLVPAVRRGRRAVSVWVAAGLGRRAGRAQTESAGSESPGAEGAGSNPGNR